MRAAWKQSEALGRAQTGAELYQLSNYLRWIHGRKPWSTTVFHISQTDPISTAEVAA